MRHLLSLLLLCLLVPLVQASTPPAEQWFSVLLDGRKIGSFHLQREARGEQVRTTQTLDITLERAGIRIGLRSSESASETRTGMPLAFESRSQLSGVEQRIQGRIVDGTVQLTTSSAGNSQSRDMAWPKGAVLSEGARLAGLRAGLKPGTRYEVLAFQPSGLDSVQLATVVGARERVDLPGGARELSRIEQTMRMPLGALQSTSWVDAQQTIHKMTLPLMGTQLVLLACDRACATAPNQDSDVFERTLLAAPRALGAAELGGTLRYTLTGGNGSDLVATAEQQVERRGVQQVVVVRAQAQAGGAVAPPEPADFAANRYLQSDAPEVVALARRAVGDATAPAQQMHNIEQFVRSYIQNKSLGVGYASALEIVRKPEGDCTEHAVLVAALGRASGIATRVVSGFAYTPEFAGRQHVFVPHAWTQAFVDWHWRSYDAALGRFDAGHLALGTGDGDPWRFYAGVGQLGSLQLGSVEAVPARP